MNTSRIQIIEMAGFQRLISMSFKNMGLVRPNNVLRACNNTLYIQRPLQSAYGSDGKTYVSILNNEQDAPLMIDSYSMVGFRMNNGLFVVGPVALFPHSILSWNIEDDKSINESSLSLFLHLAPKLDLLIIGLSDPRNKELIAETRQNVYRIISEVRKGEKINIEVMPTEKAVTTFNYVNCEQRFVAAALIPPTFYTPSLDDEYCTAYLTKKKETGDFIAS